MDARRVTKTQRCVEQKAIRMSRVLRSQLLTTEIRSANSLKFGKVLVICRYSAKQIADVGIDQAVFYWTGDLAFRRESVGFLLQRPLTLRHTCR